MLCCCDNEAQGKHQNIPLESLPEECCIIMECFEKSAEELDASFIPVAPWIIAELCDKSKGCLSRPKATVQEEAPSNSFRPTEQGVVVFLKDDYGVIRVPGGQADFFFHKSNAPPGMEIGLVVEFAQSGKIDGIDVADNIVVIGYASNKYQNNLQANTNANNREQSSQQKTKLPTNTNASKEEISPCVWFTKTGTCRYADQCAFDHITQGEGFSFGY